jgi:PAS domain S-box-containing protein
LFGYTDNELLGKPITLLIPENQQQAHQSHVERFLLFPRKRDMGVTSNLLGRRKDGSDFPIDIGLGPIATPQGQYIIAMVADISAHQRPENIFDKIIEAAPIGILVVDNNGIMRNCNHQTATIFGYELEEIHYMPVEMLLPLRHREKHIEHRARYAEQPTRRVMGSERDLTGLRKNGNEFPVEIGLTPIDIDNETFVLATITDITQRKKSEIKLKQVNADLDEFTYVASHDLKSPLRGIASLIEWVEEDLGADISAEVRNNLNRIQIRIQRMEKLIDDLLAYARSGYQQKEAERVVLQEVFDEIIQLIAPPKLFKITLNGYLGEINTPHTPLATVLRNLIDNALKHHDRDHGEINIRVTPENSYCIFDIEDDGPGIAPSAHERIFKLFQTLSNENTTCSGVGLAVCKRTIESHGGKIEVHSRDNERGTRFRFWWPRFSRSDING